MPSKTIALAMANGNIKYTVFVVLIIALYCCTIVECNHGCGKNDHVFYNDTSVNGPICK